MLKWVLVCTVGVFANISTAKADCLEKAASFATQVCGEIEKEGSSASGKFKGDIDAKANGIVTKFIGSLSGTTGIEANKDYYVGVAREQLAADRVSARKCGQEMVHAAMEISCKADKKVMGTKFVKIDTVFVIVPTKDHHCNHKCGDEPTRTGYKAVLNASISPDGRQRRLAHPLLECVAGPCAFSQVVGPARITDDGMVARADFDVWSKPMSWKLSADLEEFQ